MEVEFEEFEIASWTREELKGVKELSRGCWEWIFLIRSRVFGLDLWRKWEVNCLAKAFAVDLGLEKVLLPKEIGWLGGMGEDLPEIDLIKEKSLEGLDLWSALEMVSSHRLRLYSAEAEEIWELRRGIWGLVGSCLRRESRCRIKEVTSTGDWGIKFLR